MRFESLLIVEDNSHKLERVGDFIRYELGVKDFDEAYSFSSGSKRALEGVFDLAILDISLPTYDKIGSESGGRNRPFGGREIARKIVRRRIPTKILFITQFDAFSDRGRSYTLQTLEPLLEDECGANYLGLIHYDSSKSSWREKMAGILR